MAVIDRVKWDGSPDVLAWKFGAENLSTLTQLIVAESQEAFVVKEGIYQGPFLAGRHTLNTANIPLLRGLIAAPFGGNTPFTAEVWFVNKAINLDVRWGTPDPIQLQDPKFHIMCPVRAFGQYGIQIEDSKRFLLKLVGTLPRFDSNVVSNYMRGALTTQIKNAVADAIITNGKSILEVSTELNALSTLLKERLGPTLSEYGVRLAQFNIHSINVPEDDTAVQTLKGALAKRTELSLLGVSYQQDRSLDILQTAAGNEGVAAGVMGAGLGTGLGVGIGMPLGQGIGQIASAFTTGAQPVSLVQGSGLGAIAAGTGHGPATITCDKCGAQISRGSKFCANCSDPVLACPSCGDDNASEAERCRSCGAAMPIKCAECATTIARGSKFCPECGGKQTLACSECGTILAKGAKFCGECGTPVSS